MSESEDGATTAPPQTETPSSSEPEVRGGDPKPENKPKQNNANNGKRRGTRGGRGRGGDAARSTADDGGDRNPELPDRHREGRPKSKEAAEAAVVRRKPKIGDSLPMPVDGGDGDGTKSASKGRDRAKNRDGAGRGGDKRNAGNRGGDKKSADNRSGERRKRRRGGRGRGRGGQGQNGGQRGGQAQRPVEADLGDGPVELDEETLERRRGRERKGRPVGRYLMCVHVGEQATHIAVMEGRNLIEHYVSKPSDETTQIHGNVYLGKVQNVLPGMEAAFVDIGTPKNAVLYRGDVHYDLEDIESSGPPRIEQMLKARQSILCQVTKNPIAHKGARLTQEVSLPGRFVVLIPNSTTYGISKRLPDVERKRLRGILDRVKPASHGIIVRTAAENVTAEEIERDVGRLVSQWDQINAMTNNSPSPSLLYTEPNMALRVIREEFNKDYRGVVIDDPELHAEVAEYVGSIMPALADRVQYYDRTTEILSLFERHHVHEQLHKALDRKVWLPSGGSLIIEHTEALTVIDVNTGKNVGRSSLEETVFRNNLEAAVEVARQLRLRDIGGIIVIDFVDMEIKKNRDEVITVFRDALARDKTRTQVFDISELGLVEMTRKRIGEGLIESVSATCSFCEGRGVLFDDDVLEQEAPGPTLKDNAS